LTPKNGLEHKLPKLSAEYESLEGCTFSKFLIPGIYSLLIWNTTIDARMMFTLILFNFVSECLSQWFLIGVPRLPMGRE